MATLADTAPQTPATCCFPGCTRAIRPEARHRAKYCEHTIDGVMHNRVNAWHRRRAEAAAATQNLPEGPAAAAASLSMARAALEQRLAVKGQ